MLNRSPAHSPRHSKVAFMLGFRQGKWFQKRWYEGGRRTFPFLIRERKGTYMAGSRQGPAI